MDKELLISSIIEKGWFAYDSFLDVTLCQNLLNDIQTLPLRAAKIGKGTSEQISSEVRNDSIFWLNENQSPSQDIYLQKMNEIMNLVNREFYLGLKYFEGHFARYDKNGFYKKHLDQFAGNNDRRFTAVTYLNSPTSGGELRIYKRNNPDEIELDFSPKAGSMVCFLSNQIYHEVLPTNSERYSIAGWFRTNVL